MFGISKRRLLALLVAGLFVLGAGCAGLGASEGGSNATATDETTAAATEAATTEHASSTEQSAESGSHDDGHDHSHGAEETSTSTPTSAADADGTDATATGKMTVVVAADELDLPSRDESGDGFDMANDPHTWVAESNVTLAESLSRVGVDAQANSLTIDGETYDESTNGTDIYYRVNGEEVDPTTVTLEDGDQVWVTVETADMNAAVPGNYIDNEQQHVHGGMTVTVDGEDVDFSRSKYQSNDRHFHFEGGEGEYWHAHSSNITLDYALDSLNGVNVTEDSITFNGTTYDSSESDTTIAIEVDDERVQPSEYFLKDGDDVQITIERTED
ncbi:hypothetical protein [Haloarcula pellucida]|uniref:Uncharacterized protein n=1 Tax=Haloarcula pellucida TaxID=1427151 RepID=A0A830GMQ8_9EURY|nr:hypothetical protein [Halomicroarcula pellucida]MBX0349735.1 hypothetical protein [Halomicroarcula pellucida]GGN94058.1 hypothetical protein GCM10009030_20030 [Halomicroarcula pellucida]